MICRIMLYSDDPSELLKQSECLRMIQKFRIIQSAFGIVSAFGWFRDSGLFGFCAWTTGSI